MQAGSYIAEMRENVYASSEQPGAMTRTIYR